MSYPSAFSIPVTSASPGKPRALAGVNFKLLNCQLRRLSCDEIPQHFPTHATAFGCMEKLNFAMFNIPQQQPEKKLKKSLRGISFLSSFIMFSMLRFCSFFIAIIYSYVRCLCRCQCVHSDDSLAPVFYRALLYRIKFT